MFFCFSFKAHGTKDSKTDKYSTVVFNYYVPKIDLDCKPFTFLR